MGIPEQMLKRCPSCFYSFLKTYCYMTCSPDHSDYMHVVSLQNESKGVAVKEVDYLVTTDFSHGMFNSCKNVQMPSANEKALDILCGKKADKCTPANWLSYMGSTSNGQAPFQINIKIHDGDWYPPAGNWPNISYTPMNESATPCNMEYRNQSACSCQDCVESCAPIPPIPAPPKLFTIFGLDGYYMIMFIVYMLFAVVFGSFVMYKNIVKRNAFGIHDQYDDVRFTSQQTDTYGVNGAVIRGKKMKKRKPSKMRTEYKEVKQSDISCLEKVGEKLERTLQQVFEAWGRWCAKHPIIILVLGLLVAIALCCGILFFQVVTDPVKLWSAPDSTARTQKDYFDKHFG